MDKKKAEKQANKLGEKVEQKGLLDLPKKIESMEDYEKAASLGSRIKKARKKSKEMMDHYAKPFYYTYKDIRKKFKPTISKLKEKENELKEIMAEFYKEEKKRRDEQQKQLEEEAKEQAKDNEEVLVPEVNDIKTTETEDGGKVQARHKVSWEIVDESQIADKYKKTVVDEDKIQEAIDSGTTPRGVKVKEDVNLAVYAQKDD